MKSLVFFSLLVTHNLFAENTAALLLKHRSGSEATAEKQDALAGDVQQLRKEQTQDKVVKLLGEVETIMDEASENLIEANTGGSTISAQTEVIEKIYEAAKKKQGSGKSEGAQGMMQMMERMMGKNAQGDEKKDGKKPGDQAGEGNTGNSDTANSVNSGAANGEKAPERRIPKASGQGSSGFPEEFQTALDAYNRSTN